MGRVQYRFDDSTLAGKDVAAENPELLSPAHAAEKTRKIKWAEVKEHNTAESAWIVHNNKIYDVSNWYDHPGGAVIFTHAGDDMTDIFAAMHAPGSEARMKRFYIGELEVESNPNKTQEQIAFEKGYRDLRANLVKMGMFTANKWYYAYKCLSNMAMWAIAVAMVYYSNSFAIHMASAVLLGLFWQQCGWLAHDFLHHQVFKKRKYGDLAGVYWGNLMQGYSMQWWKNKHNGHHAVPNLHNSSGEATDGDPDIDTMPLLAWSLHQARIYRELSPDGKHSAFTKFMIKWQAFLYFPILLLARISWLNESAKTAFGLGAASENAAIELKRKGLQFPVLEPLGITLHWVWVLIVTTGFGSWGLAHSLAYFFTSCCGCGLFLALVFGLGHNGMATYAAEARPDFWKLQVTTTRNIIGGHGFPQWFVDWLCGGLQYQVDHHLFPMMPRHHLKQSHELVKSFCKEWGVKYHEADLVDGTREVLHHLAHVSDDFVKEFVVDGPTM
eukprot:gnl/TRDRNA2_/TRDRNA2_176483_c0_seq1.p1 gnl/TRDRNA2_/TRDRNA2_176483_c0~~gnl/TRDRNA2_/TRDRNA2_176483_c0_seq1.p1  ORF type:complete len:533 (+),score=91.49 gnl/TRDRNA2_/TRDRNA2_176483_c0_seq1:108-1601(+)